MAGLHGRTAVVAGLLLALFWCSSTGFFRADRTAGMGILATAHAQEQAESGAISKFRVEPLYKAARLSWTATIPGGEPVTFEIHRAMAKPEGPYTLVTSIEWNPGSKKYRYVDKNLPVEENYFYKVVIPATEESFGPLQVRPPFSLPTT